MKSLTPVVPLQRGQEKCQKTLQWPSLINTGAIMASTNHSPFIKGGRWILPPLTPPKSGGELEVQNVSFSIYNYRQQKLLTEVSRKEVSSC